MLRYGWIAVFAGCLGISLASAQANRAALNEVYKNENFQLTGISVSKSGRLFVNFPRWSDRYQYAVVEVMKDGSTRPYPDEHWNSWDKKLEHAGSQFVCVQSVVVDDTDALWVLDPATPLLISTVPGGPKLVKIDLSTNHVTRVLNFGPDVALADSYLNDVRFDTQRGAAYMTDSGHPGLVVVDLKSGAAHRVLDNDVSTTAEEGVPVVVDGKSLKGPDGKPPQFNADSIALSPDGEYLYYKPLTGVNLYRIKTDVLRDSNASSQAVKAAVEKVAKIFPTDGFWMDKQGRLYLSDVEHNAVKRLTPDRQIKTVVTDQRLQWPDTFSEGPDGAIYISSSEINLSPPFNKGLRIGNVPFTVFRIDHP